MDRPLSYIVLEFYCWNPNWDKYLSQMIVERLQRYKDSKKNDINR